MRTILVSAYACEPLKGSEQGVGWNWVLQMAKNNYLHVITRANNQEHIEAHLPSDVAQNITFHYYDTHPFIKGFKKKAKGLYVYYIFWQLGIIPLIKGLIKKYQFDYSLHLTFGSMWLPTFLPFFNVSFIWGPVGGGDGEPESFKKELNIKQQLFYHIRLALKKMLIINPFVLIPAIKSKVILVRTENTSNIFPKWVRSKIKVVLETAIEFEIFNYVKKPKENKNVEICLITTGRLMPSKNIITAVRSLKYLPSSYQILFKIIGSGSEKSKIEWEIAKNSQKHQIVLMSEVTRSQVLEELTQSDIYLFPSLREGGSWALMEAMALGLPVVCLNWSGMKIITDDSSAVRLPVTNPDQMPKDMAAAICKLIENPELRKKMGIAARERIMNEFNWDAKGNFMEKLFEELDQNSQFKR